MIKNTESPARLRISKLDISYLGSIKLHYANSLIFSLKLFDSTLKNLLEMPLVILRYFLPKV